MAPGTAVENFVDSDVQEIHTLAGDTGESKYVAVVVLQVTRFQVFETAPAKFNKIVAIAPQVSQIKAFHRLPTGRGENGRGSDGKKMQFFAFGFPQLNRSPGKTNNC